LTDELCHDDQPRARGKAENVGPVFTRSGHSHPVARAPTVSTSKAIFTAVSVKSAAATRPVALHHFGDTLVRLIMTRDAAHSATPLAKEARLASSPAVVFERTRLSAARKTRKLAARVSWGATRRRAYSGTAP
jgi:hypothetical protein